MVLFEVEDAFVHIDLKSVTTSDGTSQTDNIGDFNTSIFVGENQNSYKGKIVKHHKACEDYNPQLPTFYTKKNGDKKITLTYFVCMLNNSVTQNCELVSIMCFPNGKLEPYYKSRPLKAGKNPGKARFNFKETYKFELLDGEKKRVRIVYKNPNMSSTLRGKLSFYLENCDPEIEE